MPWLETWSTQVIKTFKSYFRHFSAPFISTTVYDDLLELVDQEIDKVIENIADDIMLELEDEEKELLETGDSLEEAEAGDYEGEELDGTSLETSVAEEEESVDETSEGSVFDLGEQIIFLRWCDFVDNLRGAITNLVNKTSENRQN